MSFNSGNLIRSVNDPKRNIAKNHNHNLSPNVRPIYNPARPIKNNLFPKNHIIFNNNNYNIKVNVINKKKEKEKIIEGDLNFNETSKQQKIQKPTILNNKPKNPRGMPRKSPLPIPRAYKPKGILNFNRIFTSKQRPTTKQYNKPINYFKPQGISTKKNNNNILGGINNNTSKTFKSLNIKNDRSHSPLLRTGQNKLMNLGIKPNKNRYVSKSPILGKSSAFNRNGGNFGVSLLNNANNQVKKLPKKTPPKVNTNIHKKIKVNNIIPNQKRNTVISGEIYQDSSKPNNKINYSVNNPQNNVNINIIKPVANNNIIVNRNINNNNLIKISNENEIKSNGISKNSLNNNNKNNEKQINQNEENNKEISDIDNKEKINIKPIYNKNENEENPQKSSDIKNDLGNNIEKEKENLNKNENNNEILKNNELSREKELRNKNNKRSQSQGPVDPLKRDDDSEIKALEEKKDTKDTPSPNKVIKKIKDILPYTHVGFDGEEPKENNQDNYFIFKNFADHKDYIYMSVCDGHGVEGHFVSEFIKEVLPYYMSENLKKRNILKETELVHQIITETFVIVNNMLVDNESINSLFSGTTCVSVIFTPERLIVPNIGDSRAVMGRYDKSTGKYKAIELSRDHKPTEKDEAKRIYENDGRIQPFTEDGEFVGPQRVWIKEEEVPGLAMTRSFGDRVAATVGVMSEPEIKEFDFCEEDKFMIIASDGIWEFISSQECIDIIQSYYENNDLKGCCEYLYQESSKRWLKEEEVIDDTTLILVFFE